MSEIKSIILYDGECGLCNRLIRFVHKHDARDEFRYAPLGGVTARSLLREHSMPEDLQDTVVLVQDGHAYVKSDATLRILRRLDGHWKMLSWGRIVPRTLRDALYERIAQNRHRLHHARACGMPDEKLRRRILE